MTFPQENLRTLHGIQIREIWNSKKKNNCIKNHVKPRQNFIFQEIPNCFIHFRLIFTSRTKLKFQLKTVLGFRKKNTSFLSEVIIFLFNFTTYLLLHCSISNQNNLLCKFLEHKVLHFSCMLCGTQGRVCVPNS